MAKRKKKKHPLSKPGPPAAGGSLGARLAEQLDRVEGYMSRRRWAEADELLQTLGPWLHDFSLPAPLRIPIDAELGKRIRQRRVLCPP